MRQELGQAGHFCGALRCGWHRHTHVDGYCVSSVGEYAPSGGRMERLDGMGSGDHPPMYYETMVFRLLPSGESEAVEIDSDRYQARTEANDGHEAMVTKWEEDRDKGLPALKEAVVEAARLVLHAAGWGESLDHISALTDAVTALDTAEKHL